MKDLPNYNVYSSDTADYMYKVDINGNELVLNVAIFSDDLILFEVKFDGNVIKDYVDIDSDVIGNFTSDKEKYDYLLNKIISKINSKHPEVIEYYSKQQKIKESIGEKLVEDGKYPSLIVALESEKDAVLTYETLIDVENKADVPDEEVIDLLNKILDDEKEHIALLSALSAKIHSEYVAEDSQVTFDEIIDSTAAEEEEIE